MNDHKIRVVSPLVVCGNGSEDAIRERRRVVRITGFKLEQNLIFFGVAVGVICVTLNSGLRLKGRGGLLGSCLERPGVVSREKKRDCC